MGSKQRKRRARKGSRLSRFRDKRRASRGGRGSEREISIASISGARGAVARFAARGIAKSRIGKRIATIARQRASRIPGLGRFFGRTQRAKTVFRTRPTRVIAARARPGRAVPRPSIRRQAARVAATGAGGAVAFEGASRVIDFFGTPGGKDLARQVGRGVSRRGRRQAIPFQAGGIVPTDMITHTWVANGVPFAQLADGRVMVRRKNGTIKTFRRPRPIVLGRNPGVRDIVRADKKIDALLKVVRKRLPAARRRSPARRGDPDVQIVRAG